MRHTRLGRFRNDSGGSIAVVLAVGLMVVLVGFISLAVDMGHLYTVRNELQNTCDAATLAAVRALVVEDTVTGSGGSAPGTHLDAAAAKDAAMAVLNNAGAQEGLPALTYGDGAVTVTFGHWEDKTSTWTAIGDYNAVPVNPDPSSSLTPNAVQVQIQRSSTGSYGPVTNFFGGVFGLTSGLASDPSSTLGSATTYVAATSRAYLGNALSVAVGTVAIPLALPACILDPNAADQTASNAHRGWFNWLVGPDPAVAATVKRFVFEDTGGNNVPSNVGTSAPTPYGCDLVHAYWFCVNQSDPVPRSIQQMLDEAAKSTHTNYNNGSGSNRNVYFVDALSYSQQIWPRSEFGYLSYLADYFQRLQTAYNAKKNANGHWRVTLPVYSHNQYPLGATSRLEKAFRYLSRLLGPAEAFACITFNGAPTVFVNGFATVDITQVNYKSTSGSSSCDQCTSWSSEINPNTGQKYANLKECLQYNTNSCWRTNYAIIENVRDVSTIIPGAGATTPIGSGSSSKIYASSAQGGGLSNSQIPGSNAPVGVGGLGSVARLIPVN